jgi:hypothetical protein
MCVQAEFCLSVAGVDDKLKTYMYVYVQKGSHFVLLLSQKRLQRT